MFLDGLMLKLIIAAHENEKPRNYKNLKEKILKRFFYHFITIKLQLIYLVVRHLKFFIISS